MTYSLTWLPEVLEAAGLKVAETPGWRTRGRAEMGTVKGVLCHHTATARGGNMPTLDMLIKGRSDLAGPLCHLGLGRDGTFYVVAAGRANHAGTGAWEGIEPDKGNSHFIGIEAENSGLPGDPWPEVQMDAYRRGVAAILKHIGAGANMCCGHKEYAPGRKNDPSFDMPTFRTGVSEYLVGKTPPPPIPAVDDKNRPTVRRGMRGPAVKDLQELLGLNADGIFGADTEAKVRAWQRAHDLVGDGIVGPRSWDLLDHEAPSKAPPLANLPAPPAPLASGSAANQIDVALLDLVFPENNRAALAVWVEPLKNACARFGIDKPREVCSFLANIGVESKGLTQMTESLNYSVEGLLGTFGRHRISEADARRLGRKPGEPALSQDRQAEIANIVYGGPWGKTNLGNTEPGDGWKFRGYGPKQIIGRDNCTRFAQSIGMQVDDIPAYLRTAEGGCAGAGWFWKSHGMDALAATPGLADDRERINGGLNGLADVEKRFAWLEAEFKRRGAWG